MIHMYWPLVVLSFVIGFGLTVALMVRPLNIEGPEQTLASESSAKPSRPKPDRATVVEPRAAKIPVANELPTANVSVVTYASYGPGSARAAADGSGPPGWLVKGCTDTRLYYTPDDSAYDPTAAHVWFQDEESAKRAFFTPWRTSSKRS